MSLKNHVETNTEKLAIKTIISFKDMSQKERIDFIKSLNPRGIAPKPPKQVYTEGCNISKLPEKIQSIFKRAESDTEYTDAIIKELTKTIQKLVKQASEHQTFCNKFIYSPMLGENLIKIFGLSKTEFFSGMQKIGFVPQNRNYVDPIYVSLCLTYTLGLYLKNNTLRILSLLIVSAKYWNSLIYKSFPNGCNPDIARYVQNYSIQKNGLYTKYGTPYMFLMQDFVVKKDKFIEHYIRQNAADPKTGMIKVLTGTQSHLRSLVVNTLAKHYYEAHEKGLKESVDDAYSAAYENNKEMIEKRETIKSVIEQLNDTFDKNILFDKQGILDSQIKKLIKNKFRLADSAIEKINSWIIDNEDDLKIITELFLEGLQPMSKEELCSINIEVIIKNIGNAKKNESYLKIKQYREQIALEVFGQSTKDKLGDQSWYRLVAIINYSLIAYIKKLICKKV